jgi:hypothetical protein
MAKRIRPPHRVSKASLMKDTDLILILVAVFSDGSFSLLNCQGGQPRLGEASHFIISPHRSAPGCG